MSSNQNPLYIKGWENGIADSPHLGVGLIRNADIESFPGAVKVAKEPQNLFHSINELTFTAETSDLCTVSEAIEANGNNFTGAAVYFTTTDTLPAGLSIDTVYYLYQISSTTFKVCTSYKNSVGSSAGTFIDITDTGTGTHTMHQVGIGDVKWILEDSSTNNLWILSSTGRVWFSDGVRAYLLHNSAIENPDSSLDNASGNGLAITPFSNTAATFLFVFRNNKIDVINVFNNTQIEALNWSNDWKDLNTAAGLNKSHEAIVGQDDAIYFCDGHYVGSIIENAGITFDPSNSSTYTYNNQALDLPKREIAQCLEELGTDLLIGGNVYNKIYPWNRISDSFGLPLEVSEFSIKRMKNIGNLVYILAGRWGNIYTTQGTYVNHFKKIPTYVINNDYVIQSNPITWGGIVVVNGALLFGLLGQTTNSSGVYKLYPDGKLIHDNTPSAGSQNVTAIWAKDNFYIMGYTDGIDSFNLTSQYSSGYKTVLHSQFYPVGTKTSKATYSKLEVRIATPASIGSIRVSYRTDKSSSFITLATYAMDGSNLTFESDIGLTDIENINIQVEMHGNMEFLEVILYP